MAEPHPAPLQGGAKGLPLIAALLAWAAGGGRPLATTAAESGKPGKARPAAEFCWRPGPDGLRQLQWALDAGLGPLLYRASRERAEPWPETWPRAWQHTLLAADLSARVRHGLLVDTLLDVMTACRELGVGLTLLKGISVSEQWYPQEHLRPMGDIDVLLRAADYPRVEAALLARGCERVDEPEVAGRQHGVPLHHAARDTVIELHTRLFTVGDDLSEGTLFSEVTLARHARASSFHGHAVQRLSPELQLAYIASSWFNDITTNGVHPSFLASLFDAVYLLGQCGATLDWDGLNNMLDNPLAAASLQVMTSYLPRHSVCPPPPEFAAALGTRQSLVGPLQLRLIHRMLDRHLIAGRPWNSALPPPVPGRYSLQRQFRKRVPGPWRRAA